MAAQAGVRKTVALLLVLVAVVLAITVGRQFWLPDEDPQTAAAPVLQQLGVVVFPEPQPVEPFTLTDQTGAEVSREDLEGQWTLAFLGYTGCPEAICGQLFETLAQFAARIDATSAPIPAFWFATADPERDNADTLMRYLEPRPLDVRGLTGEREELLSFARSLKGSFSAAAGDPLEDDPEVEFSGHLGLIAPDASLVAIAQAPIDSERLANAYRQLVTWYER